MRIFNLKSPPPAGEGVILLLCIAAHATLTFIYAVTLHFEFKTSGVDGMVYEQLLRNVLDGHGLVSSINYPYIQQPWLGFHFSPILYALLPFYAVFPHFQTLLATGSLCVALAAWPLYLTARTILQDRFQALVMALLYLANPFVVNGVVWDFHEVDFAPLCIAWMLWAVVHHRPKTLIVLSLVLLGIKEHYGLSVFGFGLLWAWHWREKKFGIALAAFGLATLALIMGVVIPHFNPEGKPAMMNADSPMDRFGWLTSAESIRKQWPMTLSEAAEYYFLLLYPFIFLPLAAFGWLLPSMADIGVNTLSKQFSMRSVDIYYSMAAMPVLIIATCWALRSVSRRITRFSTNDLVLPIVVVTAIFAYLKVALPFSPTGNVLEFSSPRFQYETADARAIDAIEAMIPEDATLAAQMNVLPHFHPRYWMMPFPGTSDKPDYIVLQLKFPYRRALSVFGNPFGDRAATFIEHADALLHNDQWAVVYYADRWVLLQKGGTDHKAQHKQALDGLEQLRAEFDQVLEFFRASYKSPN